MNKKTLNTGIIIALILSIVILLSLFFFSYNSIYALIIVFLLIYLIIYGLFSLAEKIDIKLFGIAVTITDVPQYGKFFICIVGAVLATSLANSHLNEYNVCISLDTTCKNINEKNTTLLINGNKVISNYKILNIPNPAFQVVVPRGGYKPHEMDAKVFIEHPCNCYQERNFYINIDIRNTIIPKKVSINLIDSIDKKGDCQKLKDSMKDKILDIETYLNVENIERCRELVITLENIVETYNCDLRCEPLKEQVKQIDDIRKYINMLDNGF